MRITCLLVFLLVALATADRPPTPMPLYAYEVSKLFEVPETGFHIYEPLAWEMTRRLSVNRRPIFHLLGIRRIRWPNKRKNVVILELVMADSTCSTWPKSFRKTKCKSRRNSRVYTCKGWALLREGLQLRRIVKMICRKIPRKL